MCNNRIITECRIGKDAVQSGNNLLLGTIPATDGQFKGDTIEEHHFYFGTLQWWGWKVCSKGHCLLNHLIFPRYHNPRCYTPGYSPKICHQKVNWVESAVILYELVSCILRFKTCTDHFSAGHCFSDRQYSFTVHRVIDLSMSHRASPSIMAVFHHGLACCLTLLLTLAQCSVT